MSMTYHSIRNKMWSSRNGTYRNILRTYGDSTAIVASYLMTSPHARQSGVFSCPISYIATETERTVDEVEQCLQNLEEIHFCKYDYEEEVVWVFTMVIYQVSPQWTEMKDKRGRDNRYKGVINALEDVSHSYLCAEFCDFWSLPSGPVSGLSPSSRDNTAVQTEHKKPLQGATKGLARGLQNGYGESAL